MASGPYFTLRFGPDGWALDVQGELGPTFTSDTELQSVSLNERTFFVEGSGVYDVPHPMNTSIMPTSNMDPH